MFRNYIKIALRNIFRYKGYSIINILGLAMGMASVLLILLYIADEFSYDRFHKNASSIYRVGSYGNIGNMEFKGTTTPAPLAKALMDDYDEVLLATRFLEGINTVITYKNQSFFETKYLYADTNFFKVFSFPLIKGDPETALKEPHSMVVSESTAKKYFGNKDPIGEILHEADGNDYRITGVAKDPPHNSHFHFDFLASINTFNWTSNKNWLNDAYYTYFLLQKDFPIKKLKAKLPEFAARYIGPQLKDQLGVDLKQWDSSENSYNFLFEPLTSIYLRSNATPQIEPVSDIRNIFFFTVITIFILILAIINFTSLTTARSITRAREMGMRKVMGSRRRQLVFQLLIESVFVSFAALIMALVIVELFLPTYNHIVDKVLSVKYLKQWFIVPILVLTTIGIGILAGLYSSVTISSFKTVSILHGSLGNSHKKNWYRNGLVVVQFFIAIVIIISTIVVYSQLNYIANKELGFNKENLLVIDRAYGIEDKAQYAFKNDLLKHPSILDASITTTIPGMEGWMGQVLKREDAPPEDLVHFRTLSGDNDFLETFEIEISQGTYFTENHCCDKNYVVINESAAKSLNYENPVGKKLVMPGNSFGKVWAYEIIGVVKDFHFNNMKEKIENLTMYYSQKSFPRYVTLRMDGNNTEETLQYIEKVWRNFAINQPFSYFFLEDKLDEMHLTDQKTAKVFTIFSVLALFIASLGLLSLASFTAEQKTREIGIRKAMGSSAMAISVLFLKEFIKWVIVANILAWPVAYLLMTKWLDNFVYRQDFPFWTMISAFFLSLLIAFISVGYQTANAALTNPARSIRQE